MNDTDADLFDDTEVTTVPDSTSNTTWEFYHEVIKSWLEDPGVEEHEGLNMTALKMDQAYVVGLSDRPVAVYSVSDYCFRCPFELQKTLQAGEEQSWVVNTARKLTWRVYTTESDQYVSARNTTGMLCQLRPELGQFGVYRLNITNEGCDVTTSKDPVDIYSRKYLFSSMID
ncbi:hypothetical protein O0L34_g9050 [Tuta absoluta]|nr:hypothetical protein O0L34_g9050 [Tuta absoluta]